MDPATLSMIIGAGTSMLGLAEKNKAKAQKTGGQQHLLGNRPVISLAPASRQGYSLMTMPPVGYQVLGSSANNIQPAYLKKVGGGGGSSLNMNQMNLARMGGDPAIDPGYKEDYPVPKSSGKPSTEGGPVDIKDPSDLGLDSPTTPQRLPKTEDEMKHEVELQKMSDKNAMIRQGISSAASLFGTLMRPPSAVTTGGGIRRNPPLQMFRRRRGLMGG